MHIMLAGRSGFSIGESTLTPTKLVKLAKENRQAAVGLTDTMSVTGIIEFSKAAKDEGLKPVIGARLRVSEAPLWRPATGQKKKAMPPAWFLTYYVRSEAGLKALYRLLTLANDVDHFYYNSKLGWDEILPELRNLTAADYALVLGDEHSVMQHRDFAAILASIKAEKINAWLPLVLVDTPYYGRCNELALGYADSSGLPLLAVRPALYAPDGADGQDVLTAICSNVRASDGYFLSRFNRNLHPFDPHETVREAAACIRHLNARGVTNVAARVQAALVETDAFVDAATYSWDKQPPSLPKLADNEFQAVVEECRKGFVERFSRPKFGHVPTVQEQRDLYMPRLKYELSVLKKLGFAPYFLTVQDIVRFAKTAGIMVGPGRGSVGGSLVAYLMGITEIDPIRFGLLFERFINPERIDLPDADLDFMSARRDEIIEYLTGKFGADRVAGVSNFSTLGAASVIRDVSKVFGVPEREYSVSKFVPKAHGAPVDLTTARDTVAEIDAFAGKHEDLWSVMLELEGSIRSMAQHAAGVVVAGKPLTEFGVVESRKDRVINWDKQIIEDQGLVKMDVLGLSTLDVLSHTLDYIEEHTGKRLAIDEIPLDDPNVLKAFAEGRTTGIFQFESGVARGMLRKMGTDAPMRFDDLIAVNALNRPGPLEAGLPEVYMDGRSGRARPSFMSPYMEPALQPTFGAIVYQEQVQRISVDLCGFTGAESDHLRRAIGKKDAKKMKEMKDRFIEGAKAGYVEVELEDGRKVRVHQMSKHRVVENDGKYTVEEMVSLGLTPVGF